MDFKKATELFADPNFDGDPVQVYEPQGDESPVPPEDDEDGLVPDDESGIAAELHRKKEAATWGKPVVARPQNGQRHC